jgi:hypothetical protein
MTVPYALDRTATACFVFGPPDELGTPHVCGRLLLHDGPHGCSCGFEWEADDAS